MGARGDLEVMVIHDKFIFVHMVKTGGSFLQHYFGKYVEGSRGTGPGAKRHKTARTVELEPQFKFGVHRNPFDWYVSWWAFQANQKKPGNSLPDLLVTADFPKSIQNLDKAEGIHKQTKSPLSLDFNVMQKFDIGVMTYKFLEMFCDFNWVLSSQRFDGFTPGLFMIHTTIPMEDLRDQLVQLFKLQIFPLSDRQKSVLYNLPVKNVSNREDFRAYYDKSTRAWVAHKERHLLNLFDYRFDFLSQPYCQKEYNRVGIA
jgi:hypothetical protein